jgi:transglutaminase-like putative cysteine protease
MTRPESEPTPDGLHCPGLPTPAAGDAGGVYLGATPFFDLDHPAVRQFVSEAIGDAQSQRERAVRLFYAVRDRIRYDPYHITYDPKDYRASSVIATGSGWCVPKAGLLAACARVIGIPSAIGLADVANHLTTDKLRERMGGVNVFYDHGYAAMYLEGRWLKTVPAFNIGLCERFGVRPTEFDGVSDALYQEFDVHDRRHMEYLREHGTWSDLPLAQIKRDFAQHYPGIAERAGKAAEGPADLFEG